VRCSGDDVSPSDLVAKKKLASLADGAAVSSITTQLGTGPLVANQPTDARHVINGFRRQAVVADGQIYTVVWYRTVAGSVNEPIAPERESPVVLVADTVVATGWDAFRKLSAERGFPPPNDIR
jgi:hypothetical protein